jgi:hypothetical protein
MSAYDTRGLLGQDGELVTPSDATILDGQGGFYLEQAETITFEFLKRDKTAGATISALALSAGYHPLRIRRVLVATTLNGKMLLLKP